MGYSRFWLKDADEDSKSIPHEFPCSHWLKATGQCVIERYLSATMISFAVHIVRRLHSPEKKSVLIESKRPIDF